MGGFPEFAFGLIAGYFFLFFGVLFIALCNFPKRAKVGAIFGFFAGIFSSQLSNRT
jgi:hypothetical protein